MIVRIITAALIAAILAVIAQALPDLERYLELRETAARRWPIWR